MQVVYSGAVSSAADYFAGLGYRPSGPSVNIADYMLDTVIQAPPEEATRMVVEFRGCAAQHVELKSIIRLAIPWRVIEEAEGSMKQVLVQTAHRASKQERISLVFG